MSNYARVGEPVNDAPWTHSRVDRYDFGGRTVLNGFIESEPHPEETADGGCY
jgi:hypothetical protein